MALSDSSVKLLIFFIVFSITFPVFGYAMSFTITMDLGSIAQEDLMQAGIIMNSAVSHNLTRGTSTDFVLDDGQYRVWYSGQYFVFQVGNPYVGWLWPITIYTTNETAIIDNWDDSYNWTHFTVDEGGSAQGEAIFTPYPGYQNITSSIAVGNVTLTMGRGFEQQAADLMAFAGWFAGIVFGWDTSGLPSFFVWIIRIISLIGLASAVMLVREFIPLLP